MQCPKCSGSMYDNREENNARIARGEKMRPDWKCKDKNCDGVVWRPKEGAAPKAAPAPAKAAYSAGPHIPAIDDGSDALPLEKLDHLFRVYGVIEDHVLKTSVPKFTKADVGTTPESVAAQIATLLIAAQKAGV